MVLKSVIFNNALLKMIALYTFILQANHFLSIVAALCLVSGIGLILLSNFLRLNPASGVILFVGWLAFVNHTLSLPQCLEQRTTRHWEFYLLTEQMDKWSPDLPTETKNKFFAGELKLAYDYSGKLPDELTNIDHSKVNLYTHFDMTNHEIREELKAHDLEECKRRLPSIEKIFSVF